MIKLFFKNPVFMVWVAFCLTYLFFKPNMYIFYLLFMIMIPLKCNIELFATQYVYICFSTYGTFLTLSHFCFIRIQVFMILIIYCFDTMSGIFILLPTFLLKHDTDFL